MTTAQYIPKAKKPRRKPVNRESKLQQACVKWFKYQYPRSLIYAIPNGGKRGKTEAGILIGEGVLPGIPDLCVPVPKGDFHGLYIEMKDADNGRLSDKQQSVIETLQRLGYKVVVVRSLEQFMNTVNEYMML